MENTNEIQQRDQIPAEDKWAIEDLYATDELWEQELSTIADDQAALQAFAGHLGDSAQTLWQYLDTMALPSGPCASVHPQMPRRCYNPEQVSVCQINGKNLLDRDNNADK